MILCVSFVRGFQETISNKMLDFNGAIIIKPYQFIKNNNVDESNSFIRNLHLEDSIKAINNVEKISYFSQKKCILKNKSELEGGILEGIELQNNVTNPLQNYITQGRWFNALDSQSIHSLIISEKMANRLNITLNEKITLIFLNKESNKILNNSFKIIGFYKTNMEEIDNNLIISDIRYTQLTNNWDKGRINGYHIYLKNIDSLQNSYENIQSIIPHDWIAQHIFQLFPALFEWLEIQNLNKKILYIIMSIVAIINMITCLIVLIIERIRMIGILKSLGMTNWLIQKIFLIETFIIASIGILFGVFLGVLFYYCQKYFGLISLDETIYYVNIAPVKLYMMDLVKIISITIIVCFISLIIPSFIVKGLSPKKAILFN